MRKTIHDGTASFEIRDIRIKALVDLFFPVGTIISRDDGNEPEILSYGKWIKIAPGRVLQGVGGGVTGEAGQDVEPGLPNITGEIWEDYSKGQLGGIHGSQTSYKGAFKFGSKKVTRSTTWQDYGDAKSIAFDASKSNPIYGSSDTVQPPAHIVVFWKRIE